VGRFFNAFIFRIFTVMKIRLTVFSLFLFLSAAFAQQHLTDSLIALLPSQKTDTAHVKLLNKISRQFYNNSDYVPAIEYADKAAALATQIGDKKGLAKAYGYKGDAVYYRNDFNGSLVWYLKALSVDYSRLAEHPDSAGLKTDVASACNDVGYVYDYISNYPLALSYYLQCLKYYEEAENKLGIAVAYTNIGNIYDYQGDYEKALGYELKALRLNIEIDRQPSIAILYNNLGNLYYNLGNFSRAHSYQLAALAMRRRLNNRTGLAMSEVNLASLYNALNKFPADTLNKYSFVKGVSEKEKREWLSANAESLFNEAMGLCITDESTFGLIQVYRGLGETFYLRGDDKRSLNYYEQAARIAEKINAEKELFQAYANMAEINGRLGNNLNAYKYQKLYSDLKDTVFNETKEKDLTRSELRFEYDKKILQSEKEQEKKDSLAREEKLKQRVIIIAVSIFAVILLFIALYILRNYREKQRANIEITRQKIIIEEKNREVHDSITYAQRIQNAILPPDKFIRQILPGSFVLFKPKDIVSGDFYWFEEADGKVLFAAVDCTGHGVPGAMVSVVGHNALNRAVREFGLTEPAKILDKLTELVEETFAKSENELKDGMDISLCCLDRGSNRLSWAGANNPLWIVRAGKLISFVGDKQPIGAFENRKPFTSHTCQLEKGDCVYVFTDGYADQFGGEKGKKFKYKQLQELLISIAGKTMQEQQSVLEKTISDWMGSLEQIDDICIIGIRI
jgi:serine phosphatase RsbU (regulator of sigma subunit)